jgi:type I restriction enzyme S subunit
LFTIFATLGEVAILQIDAATNQAIAGLTPLADICIDYLYFCLKSMKPKIVHSGRGVAQNNINLSILRNIKIPLPPLNIQKHIASVLDKTQEIIDGYKKQLAELDNLIIAVFYEMFGDPVLNEKGWDVKPLQKCAEIVSGVTKGRDLTGKEVVNVPYLRVANVQDGYIDISDIKTIDVLPAI